LICVLSVSLTPKSVTISDQTWSHTGGRTWSPAVPVRGAGCARPRSLSLPSGPLLLSGGRLCVEGTKDVSLWVNWAGTPSADAVFEKFSLSFHHNRLWQGQRRFLFSDAVNDTHHQGFMSQAYTSLLPAGDDEVVVIYNLYPNASYVRSGGTNGGAGFAMRVTLKHDDLPDASINASTNLVCPVYRGRILPDHGCKAIEVSVHLAADTSTDFSLEATLSAGPRGGAAARQIENVSARGATTNTDAGLPSASVSMSFKVAPASLAPGEYSVSVVLRRGSTASLIGTHTVTRPDAGPEPISWIDDQRRLIVRGRPMFPIGVYTGDIYAHDAATIGATKINTIMSYSCLSLPAMDQLHAAGVNVMLELKQFVTTQDLSQNSSVQKQQHADLVADVERVKNHPALLGWYLNDEQTAAYERDLEAEYNRTLATDDTHVTWSVVDSTDVRSLLSTFDVVVRRRTFLVWFAVQLANLKRHRTSRGRIDTRSSRTRSRARQTITLSRRTRRPVWADAWTWPTS